MPTLSVVIPTLNESDHIGHLLAQLDEQCGIDLDVIVADGGSSDGTTRVVRAAGVRLVASPPGRGRQLNAARRVARAPLLLFLHADSRLTRPTQLAEAVAHFQTACTDATTPVAGHFRLRFHDATARAFTYYEGLSALHRPQTVNGDQGLLIEAAWLDTLGGFHETLPFLEDQDLGERIRTQGAWTLLPGRLETSARRFLVEGVAERSIHNAVTMAFFSFRYAPFFAAERPRYRVQNHSHRLAVPPLARDVWRLVRRQPRILLPLARYVNRHALWRAAFWLDVGRFGDQAVAHHPWLDRYDRWLAPRTHNRWFDALLVGPTLAVFLLTWAWWSRAGNPPSPDHNPSLGPETPPTMRRETPTPRRADADRSTYPSPSWTTEDSRPGSMETHSHH